MADKRPTTFDFPQDLLDTQLELHRAQAELHDLYERLPWSVEPLPGWVHTKENGHFYESERPDSPGWTEEEKAQRSFVGFGESVAAEEGRVGGALTRMTLAGLLKRPIDVALVSANH